MPKAACRSDRITVNTAPLAPTADASASSFTSTWTDDGPAGTAGAAGALRPGISASSCGGVTGDTVTGNDPTFEAAPDTATSADPDCTDHSPGFGCQRAESDGDPAAFRADTFPVGTDFSCSFGGR